MGSPIGGWFPSLVPGDTELKLHAPGVGKVC